MEQYRKREVEMAVANIKSHGLRFITISLHSPETVNKARAIFERTLLDKVPVGQMAAAE